MTIRVSELFERTKRRLKDGGIEQPGFEARIMLRRALGLVDADFITQGDRVLGDMAHEAVENYLARRLAGEPMSRIFGEREFWSLPFIVTPDVLDPRPDTETIIDVALQIFAARPPARILDLGTGSACLLVALLHVFPGATGLGIDLSPAALNVAAGNAVRNGVASRAVFQMGSWGAGLTETFDLIVSNPPYIRDADIPNLESAVRDFDPILALSGGESGFDAYIKIVEDAKNLLVPGGAILLEVGQGQAGEVMRLGRNAGFPSIESYRDLAGVERVVALRFGDK